MADLDTDLPDLQTDLDRGQPDLDTDPATHSRPPAQLALIAPPTRYE
jgi:hypothetical protein